MKILIVHDDFGTMMELQTFLRSKEHIVSTAPNGERAIHIFRENWGYPGIEIVVTCLEMLGRDGFGVIKEIRKINPNARILLHTDAIVEFEKIKRKALALGAEIAVHRDDLLWGLFQMDVIDMTQG